ncbi:hypothetical protein PCANC_13368 [Puccinia coronata f. sp. avenae]|uniref:Uncharacterized protein n=2 Tax=Puccinia coronata f. sp. avenae TaxID=200324 RepID=A0A2N5SAA5_9BASI|nr:hypothetical protein PCANC_23562 [Puccinia coronata f. sp. avenae]PLW10172.1 hypothetical protein PCASD_19883 [Puccinia coronata f. sp. avenae]PLW51078.1 hypothetical protein PCASD_02526 [Puccinia coronata f. sp. avenae]PLW53342.1 hypothetical protein PCANC_13368 [Puccinia coronata f. sp. avenae]
MHTIEDASNSVNPAQTDQPLTHPIPSPPDDRNHAEDLDISIDIGSSAGDSLALFRSYSMPLQISATGLDDECPLAQAEDPNQDEDDEDYDELLTTPTSQLQLNNPGSYSSFQSSGQRLLSCSLPPSLSRRKSSALDIQHENPLHELLQLTQPMREGVISRERLLPSSRMKQVGVGRRGRRDLSSQRNPGSPTTSNPPGSEWSSPTKPDRALWSPASSSSPLLPTNSCLSSSVGSVNPITSSQQFVNPTPLVRPTPIAAWQRPQAIAQPARP